ncbi:hypothetical protein [Verrucosispora sioxanthis]|uniref:Uncharacterized protein n=1 Tax=Verrucosispora sioxanthis TaxID=2499994 RepID=A0A6M1LAH3_9ACTN|nr:hypothetical protein [Verrucosispora sioxanthis]NEE66141.1 hypothetical protein [Verrucosispora sioxanthis]NGM15251.1 hypothetical protein [Verrucosispora sioxanthis]
MNNSSYRDQVAMVRRIRSYRLLVVSWRLMFLSAAAGALAVLLRENDVISQAVLAVLIAPIIVVYCLSFFVVIGAGAIHSVQSSAIPLGRGILERQMRFSRMFLADLFTLPWNLSKNPEK